VLCQGLGEVPGPEAPDLAQRHLDRGERSRVRPLDGGEVGEQSAVLVELPDISGLNDLVNPAADVGDIDDDFFSVVILQVNIPETIDRRTEVGESFWPRAPWQGQRSTMNCPSRGRGKPR